MAVPADSQEADESQQPNNITTVVTSSVNATKKSGKNSLSLQWPSRKYRSEVAARGRPMQMSCSGQWSNRMYYSVKYAFKFSMSFVITHGSNHQTWRKSSRKKKDTDDKEAQTDQRDKVEVKIKHKQKTKQEYITRVVNSLSAFMC